MAKTTQNRAIWGLYKPCTGNNPYWGLVQGPNSLYWPIGLFRAIYGAPIYRVYRAIYRPPYIGLFRAIYGAPIYGVYRAIYRPLYAALLLRVS